MQSVLGGLGPNGTMMVIGAVAAFAINPFDMIGKSSAVKGCYSGWRPTPKIRCGSANFITSAR